MEEIQTEIMTHGPVEAAFEVYADFLTYKSGNVASLVGRRKLVGLTIPLCSVDWFLDYVVFKVIAMEMAFFLF